MQYDQRPIAGARASLYRPGKDSRVNPKMLTWAAVVLEAGLLGGKHDGSPMRYLMDEASRDEGQSPPMKRLGAVFVERLTRQWVVLDPEGKFWILPAGDDPWRNRLPFHPTEDTGLDPVPGHYKHVLGLPF